MRIEPLKFLAALVPLTNPLAVADEVQRVCGEEREVIDIGCCGGALGSFLIARGFRVTGVDWDPYYLEKAKERGYAKVIRADLTLPLDAVATGSFPVVVASEVIEHMPDERLEGMVRELHRICAGHLVATVPDYSHSVSKALDFFLYSRGWMDLFNMGLHHQHFTRASFTELLTSAGFEVVSVGATMGGTGMIVVAKKRA